MTEESDRLALLVVPSCPRVVKNEGTKTSFQDRKKMCFCWAVFESYEQSVQTLDDGLTTRKVDRLIDVLDGNCLGIETPPSCLI